MNPINAIFDKLLKTRPVGVEINYIIQRTPLENPIAINASKGVTVSV